MSGWTNDALESLTIPSTAGETDPRVVIATDDPTMLRISRDAGIAFYYGDGKALALAITRDELTESGMLEIINGSSGRPPARYLLVRGHDTDPAHDFVELHCNSAAGVELTKTAARLHAQGDSLDGPSILLETAGRITVDGPTQIPTMRASTSARDTVSRTLTNTSFASIPALEVYATFTAPPSGEVEVSWQADVAGPNANLVGFELREGTAVGLGSLVVPANTNSSLRFDTITSGLHKASTWETVTGLTPGAVYHARMMHFTTAGTMTVANRRIKVRPEL